jgi:hypothetical protein
VASVGLRYHAERAARGELVSDAPRTCKPPRHVLEAYRTAALAAFFAARCEEVESAIDWSFRGFLEAPDVNAALKSVASTAVCSLSSPASVAP